MLREPVVFWKPLSAPRKASRQAQGKSPIRRSSSYSTSRRGTERKSGSWERSAARGCSRRRRRVRDFVRRPIGGRLEEKVPPGFLVEQVHPLHVEDELDLLVSLGLHVRGHPDHQLDGAGLEVEVNLGSHG